MSDLTDRSICLKLWNGEKWIWTDCKLKGRPFPQDGQLMSPTLVKEGRRYLLNIPVKQENSDARTAKERMAEGTNLCSVRFTNTDTFAVCCILDEQGKQLAVHTCRGGDAYRHRCKLLETRIQKSRPNTVGDNSPQPNRKYYMHMKNLSEHFAHQVSREILNFRRESCRNHCPPDYDGNFTRMAMVKSGNFSPLHLSSKIRTNLQYKAWAEGILVLQTRTDGLKDKCAICGGKVRRKGNEFLCENGHHGNRFLNDARNLGEMQDSFLGSRTKIIIDNKDKNDNKQRYGTLLSIKPGNRQDIASDAGFSADHPPVRVPDFPRYPGSRRSNQTGSHLVSGQRVMKNGRKGLGGNSSL